MVCSILDAVGGARGDYCYGEINPVQETVKWQIKDDKNCGVTTAAIMFNSLSTSTLMVGISSIVQSAAMSIIESFVTGKLLLNAGAEIPDRIVCKLIR